MRPPLGFAQFDPQIVAAPIAYEQPTLNKAWEVFVAHIPTILIIWIATAILTGLGVGAQLLFTLIGSSLSGASLESALEGGSQTPALGVLLGQLGQFPFTVLSGLVGVLFAAVPAMYYDSGETITVDRAFRVLLKRPWRYLLAGILFTVVFVIGHSCPGGSGLRQQDLHDGHGDSRCLQFIVSGGLSLRKRLDFYRDSATRHCRDGGGVDLHLWSRHPCCSTRGPLLRPKRRLPPGRAHLISADCVRGSTARKHLDSQPIGEPHAGSPIAQERHRDHHQMPGFQSLGVEAPGSDRLHTPEE